METHTFTCRRAEWYSGDSWLISWDAMESQSLLRCWKMLSHTHTLSHTYSTVEPGTGNLLYEWPHTNARMRKNDKIDRLWQHNNTQRQNDCTQTSLQISTKEKRNFKMLGKEMEVRHVFGLRIMNKISADGRGRWFHLWWAAQGWHSGWWVMDITLSSPRPFLRIVAQSQSHADRGPVQNEIL